MAKRRIRLTESQLFGLIEQSLNELDWRAYASATNKRMNQASDYTRNNNSATKAFNKNTNQMESVAHAVSKNVIRKLHEATQPQEPYLWVAITTFEEDDETTDKLINAVYHGGELSQFDPYHGTFPDDGFANAEIGKDNDPKEEYYAQRWDFGEWILWRKAYLSEIINVIENTGGLPNDASDEAKEFVEKYCSQSPK